MKKTPSIIVLLGCIVSIIIVMTSSCKSTYPVYAKNVYVNGQSVTTDSGYYMHHHNYYEVNGKKYKKYPYSHFRKTADPDYSFHK